MKRPISSYIISSGNKSDYKIIWCNNKIGKIDWYKVSNCNSSVEYSDFNNKFDFNVILFKNKIDQYHIPYFNPKL